MMIYLLAILNVSDISALCYYFLSINFFYVILKLPVFPLHHPSTLCISPTFPYSLLLIILYFEIRV